MEIWEPKPPGTLWDTPDLLRDCFNFLPFHLIVMELYYCSSQKCNTVYRFLWLCSLKLVYIYIYSGCFFFVCGNLFLKIFTI